jgi:hypothetical protein
MRSSVGLGWKVIGLKAIAAQSVPYFDDPRGGCDGGKWTHFGRCALSQRFGNSVTAPRDKRAKARRKRER